MQHMEQPFEAGPQIQPAEAVTEIQFDEAVTEIQPASNISSQLKGAISTETKSSDNPGLDSEIIFAFKKRLVSLARILTANKPENQSANSRSSGSGVMPAGENRLDSPFFRLGEFDINTKDNSNQSAIQESQPGIQKSPPDTEANPNQSGLHSDSFDQFKTNQAPLSLKSIPQLSLIDENKNNSETETKNKTVTTQSSDKVLYNVKQRFKSFTKSFTKGFGKILKVLTKPARLDESCIKLVNQEKAENKAALAVAV